MSFKDVETHNSSFLAIKMTTIAICSSILWKGGKGLMYDNSLSVAHNSVNSSAIFILIF